jgi:prophage antirepressor-like protein
MELAVQVNKEIVFLLDKKYGHVLPSKDVAKNYGVKSDTIRRHKVDHLDELLENEHWVKLEVQTNSGKQKITHWTLDGIHMLGFFIKSPKAKAFRKVVAGLLRDIRNGDKAIITKEQVERIKRELNSQVSALTQELYNTKRELTEARRLLGRIEYNNSQVKPAVIEGRRGGANVTLDFFRYEERQAQQFELLSKAYQEFQGMFMKMEEAQGNLKIMKQRFHGVYPEIKNKISDINVIGEAK